MDKLEDDAKEGFEEIKDELKGKIDEKELQEGFVNIPTSATPKKIVNFSLNFIKPIQSFFYFTCQPTCISK